MDDPNRMAKYVDGVTPETECLKESRYTIHCVYMAQWTLELRPAWHTNNLGYVQNFSFDLRPKS